MNESKLYPNEWFLKDEDYKSRNLLGKITFLDFEKAKLESHIHQLKVKYAQENSPFIKGEKVLYRGDSGKLFPGIVVKFRFELPNKWRFAIRPMKKGWVAPKIQRSLIWFDSSSLEKATKKVA